MNAKHQFSSLILILCLHLSTANAAKPSENAAKNMFHCWVIIWSLSLAAYPNITHEDFICFDCFQNC